MPFRILLVTVFAAALVMTVRLADLWQVLSVAPPAAAADAEKAKTASPPPPAASNTSSGAHAPATPPVANAPADKAAADPAAAAQPQASAEAKTGADAAAPAGDMKMDSGAKADANAKPDAKTDAAKPVHSGEEDQFSDAELNTLQSLAKRREELDDREKALDTREGMLQAGEKRVDTKIVELKDLQAKIQGLLKSYNEQEAAKLKSLVKIYENMKPKDAAPIFEQLDMDVLLDIVDRMKEAKVAPVLAQMNPAKAKEITDELARRHELSQAAGTGGS